MRVALLPLHLEKAFRASAAGFVNGNQRTRRKLVLFRDTLDDAGHLVRAAAGSGGDYELDGLGGLPGINAGGKYRGSQKHAHDRGGRLCHGASLLLCNRFYARRRGYVKRLRRARNDEENRRAVTPFSRNR